MIRVYFHELRSNLKSLMIWTAILILLVVVALSKFIGYYNNPEYLDLLNSMPKEMLDALNMRAFNLTTLKGFYGIMAVYFYIMGSISSAMWAANAVAKEEFKKTAEFTLVLPLSRHRILTAKALASLTTSLIFVLITYAVSVLGAQNYNPTSEFYTFLRLEMLGMAFIALFSWAVGIAFATALKRPKRAATLAVIVMLIAYVLQVIQNMYDKLDFLRWFTPFEYFDAADIYRTNALDGTYVLLTLLITAVLLILSYISYGRRDMIL